MTDDGLGPAARPPDSGGQVRRRSVMPSHGEPMVFPNGKIAQDPTRYNIPDQPQPPLPPASRRWIWIVASVVGFATLLILVVLALVNRGPSDAGPPSPSPSPVPTFAA